MASTPEEIANPWRLLNKTFDDGAIPAIADQTTLMYVLHLGVGDDFTFTPEGHPEVRLRIVGALADSVLQSELIIGEAGFVRLFPRHEGYRVWMIETPPDQIGHGDDASRGSPVGLRLRRDRARTSDGTSYHQVENTYLATFQALGIARPAARHHRPRRGAGAQRARAAPRNRLAHRRRLRAVKRAQHGAVGRPGAGARRVVDRHRLRRDRDSSGASRSRAVVADRQPGDFADWRGDHRARSRRSSRSG